ncbi:hypothetical protein ACFE04_009277 [Oxalis oulophora]
MNINTINNNNWLGFSLSNDNYNNNSSTAAANTSDDDSHLCLFEAFTTTTTTGNTTCIDNDTDLSIFTNSSTGPKLEDFLGGPTTTTSTHSPVLHLPQHYHQIYDSDLKNLANTFLNNNNNNNNNGIFNNSTTIITNDNINNNNIINEKRSIKEHAPHKKTVENFGQRTSIYRGVTRHRWTGRYEAHLWDNSCRREGQSRKGRQGGYDKEEKAARAYDLAALKYWGPTTTTNFLVTDYEKELVEMKNMTRQEFIASLRRKSSGFSRGASIYRGVTRHHQHGRWQARIGRVAGNKDLYLGTFSTQEEAAEAYDIAAIKFRGLNAVTNFDMSRYDIKSIANSNLPIGGIAKSKNSEPANSDSKTISDDSASNFNFALPVNQDSTPQTTEYWTHLGYHTAPPLNDTRNLNSVYQTFNMDFSGSTDNALVNTGGGYNDHRSGVGVSDTSIIPFATPIAVNSGNNNNEGGVSNYSSWIAHPYQSAKTNLSVYQTPIFGME